MLVLALTLNARSNKNRKNSCGVGSILVVILRNAIFWFIFNFGLFPWLVFLVISRVLCSIGKSLHVRGNDVTPKKKEKVEDLDTSKFVAPHRSIPLQSPQCCPLQLGFVLCL
jgi:hypothetical protein